MPEDTPQQQVTPNSSSSLKKINFSKKQLTIFSIIFALIGVYILFQTFAAGPLVARVEAENMVMPADGARVVDELNISGGKAALLYKNSTITGQFTNSTDAVSLSVFARSNLCVNVGGALLLSIDGQLAGGWAVNSASYQSYNLTRTVKAGTHSIAINFSNDYYQDGCDRDVFVDRVDFFGPDNLSSTKPTIAFGASPASVSTGGYSTLIWGAKNATSCTASGAWSGSKAINTGQKVGPINATSTYYLTCTGPGGTATASTTVTVTNPSVGYFVGSYYDNADFTSLKFTKNDVFINNNWGNGSPRSDIAADTFSVRWVGNFNFPAGTYDFKPTSDDGVRLYIDNVLLIDKWVNQAPTTYTVTRTLSAGVHNIKLEYYENSGGAYVNLSWGNHTSPITPPPTSLPSGIPFLGTNTCCASNGSQTTSEENRILGLGVKMIRSDRGDFMIPWAHAHGIKVDASIELDTNSAGMNADIIEVDNEPYSGAWGGQGNAIAWAQKARDVAKLVKSRYPTKPVLLPLLSPTNGGDIFVNGSWQPMVSVVNQAAPDVWNYVDGLAIHPYSRPNGPNWDVTNRIRNQLKAIGPKADKKFWITEIGWPTGGNDGRAVSEANQALYLGQFIDQARARGDVATVMPFTISDGGDLNSSEGYYGVFRTNGGQKPAYNTLKSRFSSS